MRKGTVLGFMFVLCSLKACMEYTIMYRVGVSALCWYIYTLNRIQVYKYIHYYICRKEIGHCHDKNNWLCFLRTESTMSGVFSNSRSQISCSECTRL